MTNIYTFYDTVRDNITHLSKKTKDVIFAFYPKLSEKKRTEIIKKIAIDIPKDINLFYRECNGLFFEWKIPKENSNRYSFGKLEILSLDKLFTEKSFFYYGKREVQDEIWLKKSENKYKNKGYYVLDHCGNGNYTVFNIKDKTPILYWYNAYGKLNKIKLSFKEYILYAINFAGIELWQEYFVEDITNSPIKTISDTIESEICKINPEFINKDLIRTFKINKKSEFHKYQDNKKINYYQKISKAIQLFRKNKAFKKVKYKINSGVSIASLRRFHASMGVELPKELIEFYYQVNGFNISWETEHNNKKFYGTIKILSLEELMGGKLIKEWNDEVYKNQYWFEDDKDEFKKSLKRFENIEGTGSDVVISFSDKMYDLFYYDGGELTKTNLSIEEYMDVALSLMGITEWHLYYFENKKDVNRISKDEIKTLFPNFIIDKK